LIAIILDRRALDNLGKPIYRLFGSDDDGEFILTEAGETTFLESLAIGFAFDVTNWIGWLSIANRQIWLDTKSDTALISLMKAWDCQRDGRQTPCDDP
jgi:hypothetical protein